MFEIRSAHQSDLGQVVECHQEAFRGFFLTMLGPRFLTEFYHSFLQDDGADLIIAVSNDKVYGFAAFSSTPNIFFKKIKKSKGVKLFIFAIPALLHYPAVVAKKLFRGVFYRGDQVSEIDQAALLSSIAVSPSASGKNVGSKLLQVMEHRLMANNVPQVYLTTDLNNNEATLSFYKKNGYQEHSRFVQSDKREMLRLIKHLA